MDYSRYSEALRHFWWVVVVFVALGLVGGFLYQRSEEPEYVARADVIMAVNAQDASSLNSGSTFAQQQARNLSILTTRPRVIEPAVRRLGLTTPAATVAGDVTSTVPSNSSIITIEVTYPSADGATALANAVADSLVQTASEVLPVPEADGTTVNLRPIYQDTPPTSPTSPDRNVSLAVGGVAGLAVGLVLVALLGALRNGRRRRRALRVPAAEPVEADQQVGV